MCAGINLRLTESFMAQFGVFDEIKTKGCKIIMTYYNFALSGVALQAKW